MTSDATSAERRYAELLVSRSDIWAHLPRLRSEAGGTILELGVRTGHSTAAFLSGLEQTGGKLWSVDVDPPCASLFATHPQWRFVLADSRDARALDDAGLPAEIDVLFVDTIHTYEQVRDELAVWGDRVRPGGIMLFHDTDSYPAIRDAIAEWCERRRVPHEFLSGSNGLGIAYPGRGRLFLQRRAAVGWFRRLGRATRRTLRRLRPRRSLP